MQKYFDPNRFYNAFKHDLMLNLRSYVSFGVGLFLGLIFIDFLFIQNAGRTFTEHNYRLLFYFTFLITSVLVIGTSFPLLRNKKSIVHYLILPASTFEKFLIEFILRIVLFIPFFLVLFWLDFKLAGAIYNLFEWSNATRIDSFTILEPFDILPFNTTLDIVAFIGFFLTLATFLFAGASYFRKYAVYKTLLSFTVIVGSFIVLFIAFTKIFYPESMYASTSIYVETYRISEYLNNAQLFFYTIAIAASLFLLPLAYFKLKEKQL